jgi:hypothetical protein
MPAGFVVFVCNLGSLAIRTATATGAAANQVAGAAGQLSRQVRHEIYHVTSMSKAV